jgi:hypothetical protein
MKDRKPSRKEYFDKTGHQPGDRQNTLWASIHSKCIHEWKPLSFVFETQLLDKDGRVLVRQPESNNAKVYCVCMKCCGYTFIETAWVGYYIDSPDLLEEELIEELDEK